MSLFVIVLLWFAHQFLIGNNHFYVNSVKMPSFSVSTNATKLLVGDTFTMKCEIPENFKYDNNTFEMWFDYDISGGFAYYTIPATTVLQKVKMFKIYSDTTIQKYFFSIKPRNIDNITNFEIDITIAQIVFNMNFYCAVFNGSESASSINHIAVSNSALPPPPPPPFLSSSDKNVQLNHPFTLSCLLQPNTFQLAPNRSYSVAFYSNQNGLLAGYDVDVKGNSFFSFGEFEQTSVNSGAKTSFPSFDIVVTERANLNQTFWCELTVNWRQDKVESNKWNYRSLYLGFTTTSNGAEHKGKCTTGNFANHTGSEYQVQFYSSFGPKVENLLGYFWVTPNKMTKFAFEHLPDQWRSIAHGASRAFPDFEIVAQTAVANRSLINGKTWWCALHIGVPGAPYQLIKSQVRLLGNQI